MIIFLDNDYKCHLEDDGTRLAVETDVFDDKSPEYITGFRYVPEGCEWIREDGETFAGLMITPWKSYSELLDIQIAYERSEYERLRLENAEYEAALTEIENALGVNS